MKVHIPFAMRTLTHGEAVIEESSSTVHDLIDRLEARFPGFRARLCDDNGEIKRYINVFVNGQSIRNLQGRQTPLVETDDVRIVPVVSGGGTPVILSERSL